jgi:L-fuconolactonase
MTEPALEIVDAQIHQPLPLTPWGDTFSPEEQRLIAVELTLCAMEAVGTDRAMLYATAEFCSAAISRHPDKFAGVLSIRSPGELGDPDEWMHRLRTQPGLVGFRILPGVPYTGENIRFLTEGFWEPALTAAERHEVPVVIALPGHLPLLGQVAEEHPDLSIIVDHLGMPAPPVYPLSANLLDRLPDLLDLARYPNVAVKFTGVPALSTEPYPFAGLWPKLHRVVDAFRPERLMWGSDHTRVTGRHHHPPLPGGRLNYGELLNFLRYTNELGDADKRVIFGQAARRWFRWPTTGSQQPLANSDGWGHSPKGSERAGHFGAGDPRRTER